MSARRATALAVSVLGHVLAIGALVITIGLMAALLAQPSGAPTDDLLAASGPIGIVIGLSAIGTVLAWHRPQQPIGWLLLGFSLMFAASLLMEGYAVTAFDSHGASASVRWSIFGKHATFAIAWTVLTTVTVVFPAGRLSSPRWRWPLVAAWAASVASVAVAPFAAEAISEQGPPIPSLHTIASADDILFLLFVPSALLLAAAGIRLVVLLFRGDPVERRQVRWLAYSLAITGGLLLAAPVWQRAGDVAGLFAAVAVPTSIGIAVSRYRLYDIDRIISRTVAYGLVAAVLGGVFAAVTILPMLAVGSQAIPSWLVATSTLVVFALFNPVRRRVQRLVDRRFHRLPFDPEEIFGLLAGGLRDEVDVMAIGATWAACATAALQPSTAGVWLRDDVRRSS